MKVSTDSCLFGAWVADKISRMLKQQDPHQQGRSFSRILDIGTGTGLLMLMLAQKIDATIEGIELDADAFEDAERNTASSPWKERICLIHADVLLHQFEHVYDLIISNPPFYANSLKSDITGNNLAKHDDSLPLFTLVEKAKQLLSQSGLFAVMVPAFRADELMKYATDQNLSLIERVEIGNVKGGRPIRTCFLFGREALDTKEKTLAIRDHSQAYTDSFRSLLTDYYLNL